MSRKCPVEAAVEYARRQLAGVLRLVVLNSGGVGDHPQDMHGVGRFEPRVEYLARQLKLLWPFLSDHADSLGEPPASFFLRRLSDWAVTAEVAPELVDPYVGVLQYLSYPCGAKCEFCLHQNDPPGYWTKGKRWRRSSEEVRTRLRYYAPGQGRALFRTQDYAFFEITTHPGFLSTAARIRAKTSNMIAFTTNGTALTRQRVGEFAALKPLHLMVSLNSANPDLRASTMHETDPRVGVECLRHLQREGISYSVSVVPYDRATLDQLADTMKYADECEAYLIRVNFPGYSRFFPGAPMAPPAARGFWREVVCHVEGIRPSVQAPIVFQPSHVDLGLTASPTAAAVVSGLIQNSPGKRAGLRAGDTIVGIDDIDVTTKSQAIRTLRIYRALRIDEFLVKVKRGGDDVRCNLYERFGGPLDGSDYPHFSHLSEDVGAGDLSFPYGIVLQPTFDPDWLLVARDIAARSKAHDVLIITSELLEPLVSELIRATRPFEGLDASVRLAVAKNTHFLGGDIAPGDLLVVEDFIACIEGQRVTPDLALIPATPFGPWGRDISNTSYLEIERATGVCVELLPCPTVSAI